VVRGGYGAKFGTPVFCHRRLCPGRLRLPESALTVHPCCQELSLSLFACRSNTSKLASFVQAFKSASILKCLGACPEDLYSTSITALTRVSHDPNVMGGKPCIRGMRVTVGTIVGLVASGKSREEILGLYPYLEADDITEALSYAEWRVEEIKLPFAVV